MTTDLRLVKVSLHHVRGLTKGVALDLTRALHDYGLHAVARGYRARTGGGWKNGPPHPGGWRWSVCYLDTAWLASLVFSCANGAHRSTPEVELRSALAALKLACGGDWAVVDALYRLGGIEGVVAFVRRSSPPAAGASLLAAVWSVIRG